MVENWEDQDGEGFDLREIAFPKVGHQVKDLRFVWRNFKNFHRFNTFIVDDKGANIYHPVNRNNAILVQAFAPFKVDKHRSSSSKFHHVFTASDCFFLFLVEILKCLVTDIANCSEEDIEAAFKTESVFARKRVQRMGLSQYFIRYIITKNDEKFSTITFGTPYYEKYKLAESQRSTSSGSSGTKKAKK